MMKRFIVFLLLCSYVAVAKAQDLVIVHTNDMHSQLEPQTSGRNKDLGGILAVSGYIQQIRDQHPEVLYLDAGDYNQGTPYFNIFDGEAEIALLNEMGLDATTLGNHEFDNGVIELANRLKKAQYVTLCANYTIHYRPLRRIVKPYVIFEKNGHKIGVIGLTINLKGLVSSKVLAQMEYHDPIPIVNELSAQLRHKGCDMVICLTHLGVNIDRELAAQTRGVDLIIGGHSHTYLVNEPARINNLDGESVPIVQVGSSTVYVGRVDVNF